MSSSELSEIDEGYDQELSDSDFDRPVRAKKRRVLDDDDAELDEEEAEEEEDEVDADDEPEEEAEEDPESELDSEELEFLDYNEQGTPDPDRMTNRQKSMLKDEKGPIIDDFLQLPANSRQQKILSQEEQALKRTELARRRKNLSERKLEEEKMDTLNKLLYKQPKKSASGADTPQEEEKGVKKRREFISHPSVTSWKSSKEGLSLSWGVVTKMKSEG